MNGHIVGTDENEGKKKGKNYVRKKSVLENAHNGWE